MKSYSLTPVVPVITNAELADWLGVDNTDTLLPIMATTATSMAIEYLEAELIDRQRTVIYECWPTSGTDGTPQISRNNLHLYLTVKLPYAVFGSVDSVEIFGEAWTDYRLLDSKPLEIYFNPIPAIGDDDNPALNITYTAGYGDIDDIPQQIKSAVLMLAAYLYEHRGVCDSASAIKESGAALALSPFKVNLVQL